MKSVAEVETELAKCEYGTNHDSTDFPYIYIGGPSELTNGICERGYLHA